MQVTRTPADVLATLSRRYREHYGDRLVGIYAVPEFPFADEGPRKRRMMTFGQSRCSSFSMVRTIPSKKRSRWWTSRWT
jgi:hypothetical protein